MVLTAPAPWKVALAVVLAGAILLSVLARAPRRSAPAPDLRRLVGLSLLLYLIGGIASLSARPLLGALTSCAGICCCALAAWLSRGRDSGDPPSGGGGEGDPQDQPPPSEPDGELSFDWEAFERELREYAARAGSRPR
jgi:hypothetical protein